MLSRPSILGGGIAAAVLVAGGLYLGLGRPETTEDALPRSLPMVVAQAEPFTIPAPAAGAAAGPFSEAERAAVEAIVRDYLTTNPNVIRDYLLANPEVIRDAVAALEQKQVEAQQQQQRVALAQYREQIENSARQVVLGNPDGDVTLVEFFDYNCTYCKRALADMDRLLSEDSNLRLVMKEFPVLGPGSTEAAQVSVAVNMVAPEKYREFHEMLLGGQAPANADRALAAAEAVGIDIAAVRAAMQQEEEINLTLEESFALADALGLTGTPTYILANEVVVGAVGYDALKRRIDSVRACGATVC